MNKALLVLIGLSLILPLAVLARVALDCDDYCDSLDEIGIKPPANQMCLCNPLGDNSFEEIIGNIIDFILNIAIVLAPLMIVWAGGLYITSGGNPDKIKKAKDIIIYTLAGFAIILLSQGFVVIIKTLLGT